MDSAYPATSKDLRTEFLRWLTNDLTEFAEVKKRLSTHRLTANHALALLNVLFDRGEAALGETLEEAARALRSHPTSPAMRSTTAYQRIASWREFLTFAACTGIDAARDTPFPRFVVTHTQVGSLLANAGPLTQALRFLAYEVPPHTLSKLTIAQAMDMAEMYPYARDPVVVVLRWGYLAASNFYGTEKDYTSMPFLPAEPGKSTHMKASHIADALSRVTTPGRPAVILAPQDVLFVRRGGVILANRRPNMAQPFPDKRAIRAALSAEKKARAAALPKTEKRVREKPVKLLTPAEVWPRPEDVPPSAPKASKFQIDVNVAGVPALGAETLRDVFPVTVNLVGVKGYGEDGLDDEERLVQQLLTEREVPKPVDNLFDAPAF